MNIHEEGERQNRKAKENKRQKLKQTNQKTNQGQSSNVYFRSNENLSLMELFWLSYTTRLI